MSREKCSAARIGSSIRSSPSAANAASRSASVQAGHDQVALVIDDLVSTDPRSPRFVRVYGTAEVVERSGMFGPSVYLRITPTTSWSWHLDGRAADHSDEDFAPRRTVHTVSGRADQAASQQ